MPVAPAAPASPRAVSRALALLPWLVGALPLAACSSSPTPPVTASPKPSAEPSSTAGPTAPPTATASAAPVVARAVCPVDPAPAPPPPTGKKAVSIAMGFDRACAALEDGRLTCWGGEHPGLRPTVVAGIDQAVQVAVVLNTRDVFVVRKDGSLWRVRRDGAVAAVPGLKDVAEVGAGANLAAVRLKDGSVQAAEIMPDQAKLKWLKVPVKGVKQMSVGGHVCALDATEQVSCFMLGIKGVTPYSIPALGKVTRVASGGAAACATLADGTNRCFEVGQGSSSLKPIDLPAGKLLGLGSLEWNDGPTACVETKDGLECKWLNLGSDGGMCFLRESPPRGTTKPGAAAWVSNGATACLLDGDGKVSCWGHAMKGLLGEPDPGHVTWPTKVAGVEGAVSIVTGSLATCASTDDGKVTCWGFRAPEGVRVIDPKVHVVPGLDDVAKLVRVDGREICAVKKSGAVTCFSGDMPSPYLPTADAPSLTGFREIRYLNGRDALAVLGADGAVRAATSFGFGRVRATNAPLAPLPGVPAAAHLLEDLGVLVALTEKGEAWTVDIASGGDLTKPKRAPQLDGARRIVSTWSILWSDGTLSSGDPRVGKVKREKTPGLVDLLDGRSPDGKLCGVTSEGVVMCRDDKETWSRMPGLPKIVASDSYWGPSCVIDTCGGVHCWGNNWWGQTGVGGPSVRADPKPLDL